MNAATSSEEEAPTCVVADCIASPEITEPVPLCFAHMLHVVSLAMPQVVRAAASSSPDTVALRMLPVDTEKLLAASAHDSIVYFIRNGDRVKIGTTRNLRGRVAGLSLRPDNVLFAVSGGIQVERALHERFADLRVGDTEWFQFAQPIADFINDRSAFDAATVVRATKLTRKGQDSRRDLVFSLVKEAGEDGIGPEDLIRTISERFPAVEPPHAATIGRWLSADPRVSKPGYGRYAVSV
ncbi:GIY-YIG nuclease family protein [Streptomyces caniscabiei]|uniref:GIY-YIG nuclease family protein n=1 Tax=Streptomyces caniscabiei TaxID=2746961 RepID=UPI001872FFB0|nr:GIY-YIG nuclease family protein [Streptomyces caniscabiei]MBE4735724.1 GIY-YIG nuclease family protein [Streptomyces caniscabiei]MBE4758337.1 GIY-YIG nuclease family protein [Streptomyces caniscabiei]MBE4788431.1 GIY-YIG nuclease family protein [Streptomyces caniscabiei]MDX2986557.1 GIY-YIG nuclease family protein [Streptomyces caniscabiei]